VQTDDAAALGAALLARIHAGADAPLADAEFNALALAVFAHQYRHNAIYRAFCERRGARPDTVTHWLEVPAVPTDAFKAAPLLCGDAEDAVAVFRTSGTTAGAARRGQHYFPDLALYDAALRAGFRRHLLPDGGPMRMLALVPPRAEAPDSSLAHMVEAVVADFGAPGSGYYLREGRVDAAGLVAALAEATTAGEPVCLLGTSFAFVHLLDAWAAEGLMLELPHGSRVMDTGGFKGRSREVTRAELYAGLEDALGIAPEWCVNEYGMTEMSSQFYDTVAGDPAGADLEARRHRGPAWVRTVAVDPETLAPLPGGTPGLLRHDDLANLGSVMALQTQDLGICGEDGSFRLLGRAPGAEARGCSIAMDELLSAMAASPRAGG
jgi:hypothetical protein